MSKSKEDSLREKFNDKILYPFASVAGLGGAGALVGQSIGEKTLQKAVEKAEEDANIDINKPGGLNDERSKLEQVVNNRQKDLDVKTEKFKKHLQDLQTQADDILNNKGKGKVNIDDLEKALKSLGENGNGKYDPISMTEYILLQKSKADLIEHEHRISDFKDKKINDARKLLKNSVGAKALLGGVAGGTLGYGAYNMYKKLRDKN